MRTTTAIRVTTELNYFPFTTLMETVQVSTCLRYLAEVSESHQEVYIEKNSIVKVFKLFV